MGRATNPAVKNGYRVLSGVGLAWVSACHVSAQGLSPSLGCAEAATATFVCEGDYEIVERYGAGEITDSTFRIRAATNVEGLDVSLNSDYSLSGQFDLPDRTLANSPGIGFINLFSLSGDTRFYQNSGSVLAANVSTLRIGAVGGINISTVTSGNVSATINGTISANNVNLSSDAMLLASSNSIDVTIGQSGVVSASGNALVLYNTGASGRISVQNFGRIESLGTQLSGLGTISQPRIEHAALVLVNLGAGVTEITTTGEITGGSYGVAVHGNSNSSLWANIGGRVTGRGGIAIGLGGDGVPIGGNLSRATIVLLPGWETVGDTDASGVYDSANAVSYARLVFGGTAEENTTRGIPTFDLGDWDTNDRPAAMAMAADAPPVSTDNRFYGFQPILRKIGTSTFLLTDDDGVAPIFDEAIVEAGSLVLNDATVSMAGANDFLVEEGATLGVIANSQISGSVRNSGTLDLSSFDSNARSRLTVNGNYSANSNLILDVQLGSDASPSDVLVITGDTAGTTHVTVNNAGGSGALTTGNGILIIDTDPARNLAGTFVLSRPVIAGAYQYGLFDGPLLASASADGNWYLRTTGLQPAAPIYELLPTVLLNTARVSTLAQRIEGRQMLMGSVSSDTPQGAWLRIEGERLDSAPALSTTSASFEQSTWRLQAGADLIAYEGESGSLVIGLNAFRGNSSADIVARVGNGSISTDTSGLGMTATWYGSQGFYADAQLQYTNFESDLSSDALGALAADVRGEGYTASIEFGQELTFPSGITLTPQAQITWSEVAFDTFTGPNSETVSIGGDDRLQLRLGVAAESTWNFGSVDEARLYGIGNITRQLRDVTSVSVSGTDLVTSAPDWVGQIGFGGSYDTLRAAGAITSIYGEVTTSRELSRGTVRGLAGTIGVRIEF